MYIYSKSFCNLDSFSKFLEKGRTRAAFLNRADGPASEKVSSYRTEWTGTASFDEADRLFQYGDEKSAAKMAPAALTKAADVPAVDLRARRVRSVAGFSPNVPAVLQGRPKTMYKLVRQNVNTKVVTFCYDCASDWTIDSDVRAAAALKLVNTILGIEKKGYRVNLYVCACMRGTSEAVGAFVKIKDSGAYMDRKKMAYPLINTSFFRRHMFKFMETAEGLKEKVWAKYYGYAIDKDRAGHELRLKIAEAAGVHVENIVSYYDIKDLDEAGIAALLMRK